MSQRVEKETAAASLDFTWVVGRAERKLRTAAEMHSEL